MNINLFFHLATIAILIGSLWMLYKYREANRWRPINEAPNDKTLLLLRVEYHQGIQNPLFMAVDEVRDRLYYGDIFVTVGYRAPDRDGQTYYAVGLYENRNGAFFIDAEVRPVEFKPLPKPISTSSH